MFQVNDGDAAQALDINQLIRAATDTYVDSGCQASKGSGDFDVDVASGAVVVSGSSVSVSSDTVTLSSSGSDPRKDVVYVDSGGNVKVSEGSSAPAEPTGAVKEDTYNPSPPDLAGQDVAVLAEVWVGGGVSQIQGDDIRDRRIIK